MTSGTIVTGISSRRRIPIGEGEARSFLRLHMALGPVFFGMLILVVVWRAELWHGAQPVGWWYLATLFGTVAVMTLQGYLGGELVYRYGMEVKGTFRPLPVSLLSPSTLSRTPEGSRSGGASSEVAGVAPTAKP